MNRLSKDDLAQMDRDYFQSLDKQKLVEVAGNLHQLAVEQLERLEQNSSNSSRPPSSDNFSKNTVADFQSEQPTESETQQPTESETQQRKTSNENSQDQTAVTDSKAKGFGKKPPGKQIGAKGMWRTTPLVPNQTIAHHPETCAACNATKEITPSSKPHMGYYVLELEKRDSGIEVSCQLHDYCEATCECGHHTKATQPYRLHIGSRRQKQRFTSARVRTGRTDASYLHR